MFGLLTASDIVIFGIGLMKNMMLDNTTIGKRTGTTWFSIMKNIT
jgi:hypothetical protein